jgi:HlyD family secretion protein
MKKFFIVFIPLVLLGASLYWYPALSSEGRIPSDWYPRLKSEGRNLLDWFSRSKSEERNLLTAEVRRGPFTAALAQTGELRALKSVTISAQKDLPIIYLAPEGASVKEGDLMVRFDPGKYEAALEESQANLQIAKANLQRAEKDLESLQQKLLAEISKFEVGVRITQLDLNELKRRPLKDELERAEMQLQRAKLAFGNADEKRKLLPVLVHKGFLTKSSLDEAELKYSAAKLDLQAAEFNFKKVSAGATPEELQRAKIALGGAKVALQRARSAMGSQLQSYESSIEKEKANVTRAEKQIKKAEVKLARTELYAPRDGLVVYAKLNEKSGEKIQLGMIPFQGQPLIYLPDISTMVADAEVNEIDIGKIGPGGPVEVRPEAYPGTIFSGKVHEIGSLAKFKKDPSGTASRVKVFDVTVIIEEKDSRLKPGLSAALNFIVDRQMDVVSVPLSALDSRRGVPVVFVANGGKVEERQVQLGTSNQNSVIVEKGLRPGEQVVLGPQFSENP